MSMPKINVDNTRPASVIITLLRDGAIYKNVGHTLSTASP